MARRDYDEDDDGAEEEEEQDDAYEEDLDDEVEEEEEERGPKGGKCGKGGKTSSSGGKKRARSDFIDDTAIEDDEEEEDDEEDEHYGGGGRGRGSKQKKKPRGSQFFELEAEVDEDEEEEEEDEGEDGFIDERADLGEEPDRHRMCRPAFIEEEHEEDVDEIKRKVKERYARSHHMEYAEDATDVGQQALLPSVKDPKLWMVKCAIGHEREVAICLMQKYIDRSDLQIRSVIALDHLKNYIYVEADKEAHVKEACKGLRNIYSSAKIMLVPIKEMTDVLSVDISKVVDLAIDAWVGMKLGIYKGDLAKVVDVDSVRQRVTVKLIPRVDLQMIAHKLQNAEMPKKKAFVPPPRFFNTEEARELKLRVQRRRGESGEIFDCVEGLMFKDGFLYKTVSMKSISVNNILPTFDELEKFNKPGEDGSGDLGSLSTLFANRKKGHFMKGDAVIVVRGDLKNLDGWVEKVEEDIVHIKPKRNDLPKTLKFKENELCKFFKTGDQVKVVSGVQKGATGMVVKVEGHGLIMLSDTTKEHIHVFADHVVESSEITTGITRIGDYELHDLVLLDNLSFGVIIKVASEAFQVLKGVADRPEAVLVKLREIKNKIERRNSAQDRNKNLISTKDIVRVVEGPLKGKQGPVEHIHKGMLFIHDRHHLEHAGFICAKAQSCVLVGGSNRANGSDELGSRFGALRSPSVFQIQGGLPPRGPPSHFCGDGRFGGGGGGRGHGNELVGKSVRIKKGPYKGYKGRVTEVKGTIIRIELDSQMKSVTASRDEITDAVARPTTPFREQRYSLGGETPIHPSRTPLHSFQTAMRDPGATPMHDGTRTPMQNRYPMSPARDTWEDGNPATWGSSPAYHPSTPPARPHEAPTAGSGWTNTPGGSYNDASTRRDSYANAPSPYVPSKPVGQPMTPSSASYLPGAPGQPMTPVTAAFNITPLLQVLM